MRPRVLIDTGAFVALARPSDSDHRAAIDALAALTQRNARLVSTNYTFAETYATLLARAGHQTALMWGSRARAGRAIDFVRVDQETEEAAWAILESHADKNWSYVDAVSFALMEREGISTAFAFDKHFTQRGLAVIPA